MHNLQFEWDERKNAANQRKHGVAFAEAQTVFSDELGQIIDDPDHSDGEQRFLLIGLSAHLRLLMVCHCERAHNSIRIISARPANRFERQQYEG